MTHRPKSQMKITATASVSQNMKVYVVVAKVEELQARCVERVFNSKDLSILKELLHGLPGLLSLLVF